MSANSGPQSPAGAQVHRTVRRVAFHETDAAGIAHFASFYLWMEQAEHELLRSQGFAIFMDWEGERVSWPRVACRCQFQRPVRFEDELQIVVRVTHLGRSSVRYRFDFSHAGQPVACGFTTAACCQIHPTPTAIPIPAPIRLSLQQFLHPELDHT